jgi:hypothetical protein
MPWPSAPKMRQQQGWCRRQIRKAQIATQNASINTTLVKALVRAHLWQRQLKSGKYQTMQDNFIKLKYCSFFITRTFCLKCSEYVIIYLFRLRYISLTILGTQKFINS